MATVVEILETVEHTPGCVGLLPVEDSFEGEHTAVLDRLIFETSKVYISEEVVVSERLDAFRVRTDAGEDLRVAVSHPKAIEHCHRFVREHGLATRFAGSTTDACRMVAESGDPSLVAIAPAAAAERYGLTRVMTAVDDVPDARTRFFLVGRSVGMRSARNRTTLVLTQPLDRSGNLERFLRAFADNEVNLVSLHSRPLGPLAGSYCFLATAEAHIHEARMTAVIEALWEAGAQIKLLGSYPEWEGEHVVAPFDQPPLASIGPLSDAGRPRAAAAPGGTGSDLTPMPVVEYLGPEGTFAHEGTDHLRTVGGPPELVARATVAEVIHDVDEGRCDFGLVPLENSIEGGVTSTIDVLVFEVGGHAHPGGGGRAGELRRPPPPGVRDHPADDRSSATPPASPSAAATPAERGLTAVPTDSTSRGLPHRRPVRRSRARGGGVDEGGRAGRPGHRRPRRRGLPGRPHPVRAGRPRGARPERRRQVHDRRHPAVRGGGRAPGDAAPDLRSRA